jgi:hypothetical protein
MSKKFDWLAEGCPEELVIKPPPTDRLTHWRGCDSAHPECAHPAVAILTDLITELRGYRHRARSDMADEYEQRLREVQNASL